PEEGECVDAIKRTRSADRWQCYCRRLSHACLTIGSSRHLRRDYLSSSPSADRLGVRKYGGAFVSMPPRRNPMSDEYYASSPVLEAFIAHVLYVVGATPSPPHPEGRRRTTSGSLPSA